MARPTAEPSVINPKVGLIEKPLGVSGDEWAWCLIADLLRRVGWEFYRVGLAEVSGVPHVAPSAVFGEELLVDTDRAFDCVHSEG